MTGRLRLRGRMHGSLCLACLGVSVLVATPTEARITRIQIIATESPTFGGYSWPGVGQYEKIVGKAFGEVDPTDPKNAVVVDIALAPRNVRGNVEYAFDFYILKPIDLTRGAHKMMYEPPNRGSKTWSAFARVPGGNDPGSITDPLVLADAFLLWRTQIKNNLSIVAGRHTFKVGGEWLHTVNDQVFRGFFEGRYLSWVRQMVCGGQADRIAGIARSIPSRCTHVS